MSLTVGTITHKSQKAMQQNNVVHTTLDLDASYPEASGGYDCDAVLDVAGVLAGYEILHIAVMATGTYHFSFDAVANKLKVFVSATGAEVANAFNLAAITGLQATIFCQ